MFSSSFFRFALVCSLATTGLAVGSASSFANTNSSAPNAEVTQQFTPEPDSEGQIIIPPNPNADDRAENYDNLVPQRDLSNLPDATAKTREKLMEAARSGDVENFRAIIETQPHTPRFSFGEVEDPVQFLRESSNDGEGLELMAIMLELLEAPYAVQEFDGDAPNIYVWPAYATHNLQGLSPEELVEVYKIVSHLDVEEMRLYGGWYFFRIGINEDGAWQFFVAGD